MRASKREPRSSFHAGWAVPVVALALLASCAPPRRAALGTACARNSDCDAPLVCRLGFCRNECATSADCGAGLSCVLDPSGLGACQLAPEAVCTLASECPEGLVCRFMQCTNACQTDRDCPGGARCEREADGLACVDPSERPCVLDEECDPRGTGQRCLSGRCRQECFTDRDCRNDFRCRGGVCTPPPGYDCSAFDEDSGWTVRPGFRAVVVADAADGISAPSGLTFAGGPYGGDLFVASAGSTIVHRIDLASGETTPFTTAWGARMPALSTIVWDESGVRDGALYVGDQGTGFDADSAIFRLAEDGTATEVVAGPGPGLDDVFVLAFAPAGSAYPAGLYVTGDTDNTTLPDWGIVAGTTVTTFSEVSGVEGAAFDPTGLYGGWLWAARPLGRGYAGDATITPVLSDGTAGAPLLGGEPGIHAVTFSEGGAFGARMYAASWSSGTLLEVAPDGTSIELARGLTALTEFDADVIALSPDGQVMLVAERLTNRVVCIAPL